MDKNQLHEAVCRMKSVLIEMLNDNNDAWCKKQDWYDYWLDKVKKGEVTQEWFKKNVWDVYHSEETAIPDTDYGHLQEMIERLELVNEKVAVATKNIEELYSKTKSV